MNKTQIKSQRKFSSKRARSIPLFPLLLAFSILSIIAYTILSRSFRRVTPTINEVSSSDTPLVKLSLPTTHETTLSSLTTLDLSIFAEDVLVTAVQVELEYDPSAITTPIVTQGNFLTDKLGEPQVENGHISFVFTTPIGTKGQSGSGSLATLSFKTIKDSSKIDFTANTMVAAYGYDSNVLEAATGTTITLRSENEPDLAPPPPVIIANPSNQLLSTPNAASPKTNAINAIDTQSPDQNPSPSFLPENDFNYDQLPAIEEETTEESSATNPKPNIYIKILSFFRTMFHSK